MPLCNILPWVRRAQQERFAIGAFNANTLEQVQAIAAAAQAERAPVIIQISRRAALNAGSGSVTLGLRYLAGAGCIAAESVSVPVALHLDHAGEAEVLQALALGFTSVMFDGSDLPTQQNIDLTCRLRDAAHAMGASIEAELGEVPRADRTGSIDHPAEPTGPEDAANFARATGVDLLAISIGSVHAIKEKRVALDIDRLKAIRLLVDTPLVLHGSSGVMDDHIASAIASGICKVNVATQLNQAFTSAIRERLGEDPAEADPRTYLSVARQAMTDRVRERIRFVGASDKA